MDNICATYEVGIDLLDRIVKYFLIYDHDKFIISDEFYMNYLNQFVDGYIINDSHMNEKISWSDMYKDTYVFINKLEDISKVLGHHITYPFPRNLVYKFIYFCIKSGKVKLRLQQIQSFLQNDKYICQAQNFIEYIMKNVNVVVDFLKSKKLNNNKIFFFEIDDLYCLGIFFKQVCAMYNILLITQKLNVYFNKIVTDPYKVGENYLNMQEDLKKISDDFVVSNNFPVYVLDHNIDDFNFNKLTYPVHDVKIFKKQQLFEASRVYLFVGAAGIGKSMLLSHIAGEFLIEKTLRRYPNKKEIIYYFTFENSEKETAVRIFANCFRRLGFEYTINDIKQGKISDVSKEVIKKKIKENNRIIYITYLDPGMHTTKTLDAFIEKTTIEKNGSPYAILIDYIDEMRSSDYYINKNKNNFIEHLELGEIIHDFKSMAVKYDVPVITVSHLNADGCRVLNDDIEKLGANNVGKSIRKYERSDVVAFVGIEDNGMGFKEMKLFFSKHRYAKVSSVIVRKFQPEYSFIDMLTKEDLKDEESDFQFFS